MKVTARQISHKTEEIIVCGLIMDDDLCKRLLPKINEDYFKSKALRTVIQWIRRFFNASDKAPKSLINEILETERENPKNRFEDIEIVESVLQRVSDRIEEEQLYDNSLENTDFVYNLGIKYLNKRDLEIRAQRVLENLDRDDLDSAKSEMQGYSEVLAGINDDGNPFTQEKFQETMNREDGEDPNVILRFNNAFDNSIGPLKRGWFVSFIGPMKSGKTFFMMDWGVRAMMQGRNVLYFNLEVPQTDFDERLYQMVASKPLKDSSLLIPTFTCAKFENAENKCDLPIRSKEKVCNVCALKPNTQDNYVPAVFMSTATRGGVHWKDVAPVFNKKGLHIQRFGENKFRRFSPFERITVGNIESTIQDLNYLEGWLPDVIIIDYADLMTAGVSTDVLRHQLDDIWVSLRMLAKKYNALVITATQTNREGTDTRTIKAKNVAEDIRKLAHVTMMLGINRYAPLEEPQKGICRISTVMHRHRDVSVETMCLQGLNFSNPCIDCINISWGENNTYLYKGR